MAKKTATKEKKGSTKAVEVNFRDVEGRGGKKSAGQARYKPGDYAVKVKKAYWDKSGNKGTKQLVIQYVFLDGKNKGKSMYQRCNLLPQSLWVLRNALEAMGLKVKTKEKVDPKKLKDKKLAITIEDDEYKDKKTKKTRVSSKVTDTFLLSELEEAEEAPELDEDEDEEDEEDEDLEEDDDEAEDEEDEEDEDEDEEDEDEEDEDEEIEEVDEDDL